MAYNWAQLAFVEKWRLEAVRGRIVGMYRPEERTFFDLRLFPGEGGVRQLPGPIDVHLVDVGDLVREKRMVLFDRAAVVVRIVGSAPSGPTTTASEPGAGPKRPPRWLEVGTTISGNLLRRADDAVLLDIGFPVIVEFKGEWDQSSSQEGNLLKVNISQMPQGFFVV